MLATVTGLMLTSRRAGAASDTSQLLLIVSDGRGLFLEGMQTVRTAVRQAQEAHVFTVFVVLDNPESKVSHVIMSHDQNQ